MFALAACGSSAPPTIETTSFAPTLQVDLAHSTKVDDGLYYRDITPGSGTPAAAGHTLSVNYTGWLADGIQFDSNQYSFVLGAGVVIPGWDFGLPGIEPGGTRQLIIGPNYGYGATGQGPIPPNAILVFNVQAVSTN